MKQALTAWVVCIPVGIHAQNEGTGTWSPNKSVQSPITKTSCSLLIPAWISFTITLFRPTAKLLYNSSVLPALQMQSPTMIWLFK
jgi:hypothetical protein